MTAKIAREEIIRRLKKTIQEKKPIIGAGVGVGLIAKCAEAGGADFLIIFSTGPSRMKGLPTSIIHESNRVTMELYDDISRVVKNTPIIAGIEATDPATAINLESLVQKFIDKGFSGVINLPTVIGFSDPKAMELIMKGQPPEYVKETQDWIEEIKERKRMGFDFSTEVELIRVSRKMNIFTASYVSTPEQARHMANAGVDVMIAHCGGTSGGMTGFASINYQKAAEQAQSVFDATRQVNADIILLGHGGPFAMPEDTKYLYEHTDAAGFVGGSSIERIPIEKAIKGVLEELKSMPLKAV